MRHNIKRIFTTGWVNFKRNSYLSFAVTGVMALVLLVFLGLMTFQFLTAHVVSTIQAKVDISAYFKTDAPDEHILAIKDDLEKLSEVREVRYTSREQAYEEFKNRHADNALIQESLEQLDSNPFEASLNIRAVDPERYENVAAFLENNPYREEMSKIDYNENKLVIDKITSLAGALKTWGLFITIVLAVIAILVAFNTIRLTIYNQKQEIEIMRLVGASNWHIRGPYLAEGVFYGAIAAFTALVVFYPVLYIISGKLEVFVPEANLLRYFAINSWQVILLALFLGAALGVLSSVIAIRKHLKI